MFPVLTGISKQVLSILKMNHTQPWSRNLEKRQSPVGNVDLVFLFNNLAALRLYSFAHGKAEQGKRG